MGAILANFAFFGDLITNEDLEETYRTLYFFESPLYVCYGKNTENTPNSVCNDILFPVYFFVQKIRRRLYPPISGSETCHAPLAPPDRSTVGAENGPFEQPMVV